MRRRRLCGQCAINDRRIKALETVSAVNIGAMLRNGWEGKGSSRDAFPLLEAGSQARTTEANGSAQVIFPLAPLKEEDAFSEELREAWVFVLLERPHSIHKTQPLEDGVVVKMA